MDKKTFSEMMKLLQASFREKINEDTNKAYWDILKEYSDNDIKRVTVKCIKELKFFPKIAEMRELIEGNLEDEAKLAWLYLLEVVEKEGYYMSPSFPKYPAIVGVVERFFGGWMKLIEEMTDENLKWIKNDFLKFYPVIKKEGHYPEKAIGFFELTNSNKGFTDELIKKIYGRSLDGEKLPRKLLRDYNNIKLGEDKK